MQFSTPLPSSGSIIFYKQDYFLLNIKDVYVLFFHKIDNARELRGNGGVRVVI